MHDVKLEAFLDALHARPWFANVGQACELDPTAVRIHAWTEYPGPEDEHIDAFYVRLGELEKKIAPNLALGSRTVFVRMFQPGTYLARNAYAKARDLASTLASDRILETPEEDPWHPQTAAVMLARHVAGLVAAHHAMDTRLGAELARVWSWLEAGHWPCGYAPDGRRRLLVF